MYSPRSGRAVKLIKFHLEAFKTDVSKCREKSTCGQVWRGDDMEPNKKPDMFWLIYHEPNMYKQPENTREKMHL